jgi:hypothetical protein
MRYEAPKPASWADVEAAIAQGDADAVTTQMVGAVETEQSWRRSQDGCLGLLGHPAVEVRGLAVTCLGHVARIHRQVDRKVVLEALKRVAREEPDLRGRVEDALSDIETFASR